MGGNEVGKDQQTGLDMAVDERVWQHNQLKISRLINVNYLEALTVRLGVQAHFLHFFTCPCRWHFYGKGMANYMHKITDDMMKSIVARVKAGERMATLAAEYGVSRQAILIRLNSLSETGEHTVRMPGSTWLTPEEEARLLAKIAAGPPLGYACWTVKLLRQWARKEFGKMLYLPRLREFAHYQGIYDHEVKKTTPAESPPIPGQRTKSKSMYRTLRSPDLLDEATKQASSTQLAAASTDVVYQTKLPSERPKTGKRGRPRKSLFEYSDFDSAHFTTVDVEAMRQFKAQHKEYYDKLIAGEPMNEPGPQPTVVEIPITGYMQKPSGKHARGTSRTPKKKRRK